MLLDLLKRKKQVKEKPAHEEKPVSPKLEKNTEHVCSRCSGRTGLEQWQRNLKVCPACGYHDRFGARERLEALLDKGTFKETGTTILSGDPLEFPDYPDKLAQAKSRSGEAESVITGSGNIAGIPVCVFAMEPDFMMGSLGSAAGERIAQIIELAGTQQVPVIGFCASGGARMQEGILSLMQMAKTAAALGKLSEQGIPYFAVLTDPTTGGVTASYAMLGDVILAEPGALIGFAGQRVIEQTIRQSLPEGFQRAEFLLEKGFVDRIVPRNDMKATLILLLRGHAANGGANDGSNTRI